MNAETAPKRTFIPNSEFEQLREGRAVIEAEAAALQRIANQLDTQFCAAVDLISRCEGTLVVTGMGKAGLIGRKIAATLSSTGTPSFFLHPGEAVHGDMGSIRPQDILLVLSNSGETEEVCRILPTISRLDVPIISMTSSSHNRLAVESDIVLQIGRLPEAGLHGLPPSTTTTAMLAMGDALAIVIAKSKGFTPDEFALNHPAGSLGKKLTPVSDIMRKGDELRVASETQTVREIFSCIHAPGRRTGAVMLVDEAGTLSGLFTDSDLAKLLELNRNDDLDAPVSKVMTEHPQTISPSTLLSEVVEILSDKKLSELPVIDENHCPIGLVDITDVIGLMPKKETQKDEG